MAALDVLTAFLPALCLACRGPCPRQQQLCGGCDRRLAAQLPLRGPGPAGVDGSWSAAPHEGVARDLVVALKFRSLLPAAELIAARIAALLPAPLLGGAVVPVPTAPSRSRRRGFDPAAEVGVALAGCLGAPFDPCLRRRGGARQVGRRRAERLASAPAIEARGAVPTSSLLVDDVLTTGATLAACARALRGAGARRIVAVTFTRRL